MIKYDHRQLTIEGIPLEQITANRPTPFYLYSTKQIERNIEKVREVFAGMDYHLSFAAKANNNLYLLAYLKELGVGIDIVSSGEFSACKRVGFHPEDVIVNGNGKKKEFLKALIAYQPRAINVDSKDELVRIEALAAEANCPITVALRVNPDVDPITHPYISTGLKKNKFGMDLETAAQLITVYLDHPLVRIEGLHLHIGSQLLQIGPYVDAYIKIGEFINGLKRHTLKFINIGGGWGIDYMGDGHVFPLEAYKKQVLPIIKGYGMEIILELGRFIIGNAAVLIGQVEYVKETPYKTFVVTDASMADLIRPSLYAGYHHIYPQYDRGEAGSYDIVGPLCETGDRFAEDRPMKRPQEGEYVAICDVGAYGYVMSSNYNFSLRPAEYLISGSEIKEIRPREDFDQLTNYYQG